MIELKILSDGTVRHPSKLPLGATRWAAVVKKDMDKPGGLEREFLRSISEGQFVVVKNHELRGRVLEFGSKLKIAYQNSKAKRRRGWQEHEVVSQSEQHLYRVDEVLDDRLLCTRLELTDVPGAGAPTPPVASPVGLHMDQLNARIAELEPLAAQTELMAKRLRHLVWDLQKPWATAIQTREFKEFCRGLRALNRRVNNDSARDTEHQDQEPSEDEVGDSAVQ